MLKVSAYYACDADVYAVLFASVQQDLGYEEEQSVLLLEKYSTVQAVLAARGMLISDQMM